ncbi:MAG: hypothetical protein IJ600_08670 [Lachnospiraceae bacterium]|nr:hypothetical protein [Lachnospiraceae bacterium]
MKEVIEKILTGKLDFAREVPPLSFSCDEIVCETAPDREIHGTFDIYAPEEMKGYIYSRDLRFTLTVSEFQGKSVEIGYTMDTHGLPHGAVHSGKLAIVTDHGEYEMPYRLLVSGTAPESELGEIRNLFHFANLAKADWAAAQKLFYSPAFLNVLSGNDAIYQTAYRGFSAVEGNGQNMENFLETARKKTRPVYRTDIEEVEMDVPPTDIRRHINIVRDGWGYTDLNIRACGDFLAVDQELLTEENFSGNVGQVDYRILRSGLVPGDNVGEIVISEQLAEIRIPVTVHVPVAAVEHEDRLRLAQLMHYYMDYRTERMPRTEWAEKSEQLIGDVLAERSGYLEYRLYQVHVLLATKRYEEASSILKVIGLLAEEHGLSREEEAYYMYLQSLRAGEPEFTAGLAEQVEELYLQDESSWRLAWVYMYMDGSFEHNDRKKWRLLKKQYEMYGNASPIIFLEALQIILQAPKRMDTLESFELGLMHFALRRGLATRELRERFAFLSMEEHVFSEELAGLLMECCALEESVVMLEALSLHLIRGNCIGEEYFPWYQRAVERELRLSRLYEYYMMSLPAGYKGSLPKIVLMYFAYRSPLDAEHNALLYANVLRHKNEYQELYEQYLPTIMEFAQEQLLRGKIDEQLAYIYKKLLSGKKQENEYLDAYTEMLFMERITVSADNIVNVILVDEHLKGELSYPIVNGEAYVPVYGDNSYLLVEDTWGNRYTQESVYTRQRLLKEKTDLKRLQQLEKPKLGPALYLAVQSGESVQVSEENAVQLEWLSEREELVEDYRRSMMIALAEYYFDNDLIEPLDRMLRRFEPLCLSVQEREVCVRIMVARGMYDDAFSWIQRCGTEGISVKVLVRLCDRLLARNAQDYDLDLVKICQGILDMGKYDEEILAYLLKYSGGTLAECRELWRAADSFEMDVQKLLEKTMLQILFTGAVVREKVDIYLGHLDGGMNTELEKAYLARLCYDYFIRQEEMDVRVFERVAYLYRLKEELLPVCILAYLKAKAPMAAARTLAEQEETLCRELLLQMRMLGIMLPYFADYAFIDPGYRIYTGVSFIEYHGHADSQVVLHYVYEQEGTEAKEYYREEMQHVFGGIYVKRFLLFFGEKIHYYITEEDGRQEKLTRSSVLEYTERPDADTGDRFSMLNNLALARDMKDEQTYLKLSEEYHRQAYIAERLFVPGRIGRQG